MGVLVVLDLCLGGDIPGQILAVFFLVHLKTGVRSVDLQFLVVGTKGESVINGHQPGAVGGLLFLIDIKSFLAALAIVNFRGFFEAVVLFNVFILYLS